MWHFQVLWWRFSKFSHVNFPTASQIFSSNLGSLFSVMKDNNSVFLRSKFIYFAQKKLIEEQIFENFEYLDQNSKHYCHFRNNKSIFLRILHTSSVSWDITPLYLFSSSSALFWFQIWHEEFDEFSPNHAKVLKILLWWTLLSKAHNVVARNVQRNCVSWHWKVIQNLKKKWLVAWKMTKGICLILMGAVESPRILTFMSSFCTKHTKLQMKKYKRVMSHDTVEWSKVWWKTDSLFQKWYKEFS